MISTPSLDGFDVPAAVERMLGQPELWWQALALFVGHFSAWEQGWADAEGDASCERRVVHALGSGAANVGAVRLEGLARRLEGVLLGNDDGRLAFAAEALRDELRACFRQTIEVASAACASHYGDEDNKS